MNRNKSKKRFQKVQTQDVQPERIMTTHSEEDAHFSLGKAAEFETTGSKSKYM